MITIELQRPSSHRYALTHLGFRPFFLLAGGFAVVSMVLWLALYSFAWQGLPAQYPSQTWHAHEMIFGYLLAVVAGFLLTAVKNWTGQQTLHQAPLMALAAVWLLARVLPFTSLPLIYTAVADLSFQLILSLALMQPIIRARQWQQFAIIGKLLFMLIANSLFYLGLLGIWPAGSTLGLYMAFYLFIALTLTMARRVMPFFIEKGVGVAFTARNYRWLDYASLGLFLSFMLAELSYIASGYAPLATLVSALALLQIPLHILRLAGWYHPAIWRKPLLWVLYAAYGWLILGFALKGLSIWLALSPWLAVHAFAYGGLSLMTVGMMARVILGHTGRNVFAPPPALNPLFALIMLGAVVRVFCVALWPQAHTVWIVLAQVLWIAAFSLFLWIYAPMLIKARVDGRYG
jgi:uncharacterized protein involved in response to NO